MMTQEQKEARLKIIAKAAKKVQRKKKLQTKSRKAVRAATKKPEHDTAALERKYSKIDDTSNVNAYTDSSAYAEKFYGETYEQTYGIEKEWN
jgi:hypothetical protein